MSRAMSRNARANKVKDAASRLGSFAVGVRYEHVAETPDRLDVLGVRRIVLDDLAQARDLHVDRAVEHLVLAAAREFHQLVARERLARMLDQHLEHRELAGGERHALALAGEGARREVELEAAEAVD